MAFSARHSPRKRGGSTRRNLFKCSMIKSSLFSGHRPWFLGAFTLVTSLTLTAPGADNKADLPAANIQNRVDALLAQMTPDEKIGQMVQVDSGALKDPADVQKYFLGSVLSGGSSDPAAGNSAQSWLDLVAGFEKQALQTRLKTPLIYGIDAVHGHNNIDGAVIFPHHIGLGATHDPKLVEQAERVTAEEVAGTGIRWAFAPCIAVAQDEHWGRTYESFGEAPELVSELGAASVRGFQGAQLDSSSVLACAKHFIGDGGTQGGKDQGNAVCDEATLRTIKLPPHRAEIGRAHV